MIVEQPSWTMSNTNNTSTTTATATTTAATTTCGKATSTTTAAATFSGYSECLLKMNDELITIILNEWVTDNDDDKLYGCWRGLERKVTSKFRQLSAYDVWSVLDCQEYIRKQKYSYNQLQTQLSYNQLQTQ
jgi:hypothetical protein